MWVWPGNTNDMRSSAAELGAEPALAPATVGNPTAAPSAWLPRVAQRLQPLASAARTLHRSAGGSRFERAIAVAVAVAASVTVAAIPVVASVGAIAIAARRKR